ncbi:MAG TPA: GNAT family N-acetyltransferase [Steroidobacteraceae bacterium]|nr:GNAT family N-acetyltransferase [Steroidobacteraceae bacterium]
MIAVHHDPASRRFMADVDGERAVLDYTLSDNVMTITHTGVPRAIEGRGIAGELMREALASARSSGWRVVPACSYAAAYIEKHPDEAPRDERQHQSDLLDEALDESFPASDPPSVGRSS